MARRLFIVVCLATSVFIQPAISFGDKDLDDPNLRVSEGRVTAVDRSGSAITVDAGMPMVFPVSSDTKLRSEATMYSDDIKLSDIGVGDNVTVEYVRKGEDSRIPAKVTRVTVENKAGGNK
ncbi:MAG: hypothetical protein NTZ95_08455 [Candidatus Omnitrophica bacterium]|nr:hypothetical protein [Candidatus Omnitrophota bacterium]